jgi:hypothetical protein
MTTYKFQWTRLVAAGLVSGLILVTIGVAMYLMGVYFARGSLLFFNLVFAACIVTGTRWVAKHVLEDRTTYWSALLAGVVIAACTGVVYVTYNIVSIQFVYPHFLEDMVRAEFARQQALGMDASQAAQTLEALRRETTVWIIAAGNLRGLVKFGIVFSALTAIAFRQKRIKAAAVAHARS